LSIAPRFRLTNEEEHRDASNNPDNAQHDERVAPAIGRGHAGAKGDAERLSNRRAKVVDTVGHPTPMSAGK
jgi:hypothetical protein